MSRIANFGINVRDAACIVLEEKSPHWRPYQAALKEKFTKLKIASINKKDASNIITTNVRKLCSALETNAGCLCFSNSDSIEVLVHKDEGCNILHVKNIMGQRPYVSEFKMIDVNDSEDIQEEWDELISCKIRRIIFRGLMLKGWINLGFPEELEGKVSPTIQLLVQMQDLPGAKRSVYASVLVELTVKQDNISVAFQPVVLCTCPLDLQGILKSDKNGKSERIWAAGGAVDLTQIAEQNFDPFVLSGCCSLACLRTCNLLAISKSPLSSWLTKRADPNESEDLNILQLDPEQDPVYQQLHMIFHSENGQQGFSVLRGRDWPHPFIVNSLSCVLKSAMLQPLSSSNQRYHSVLKDLTDSLRQSVVWTGIDFHQLPVQSLRLRSDFDKPITTISVVPRAGGPLDSQKVSPVRNMHISAESSQAKVLGAVQKAGIPSVKSKHTTHLEVEMNANVAKVELKDPNSALKESAGNVSLPTCGGGTPKDNDGIVRSGNTSNIEDGKGQSRPMKGAKSSNKGDLAIEEKEMMPPQVFPVSNSSTTTNHTVSAKTGAAGSSASGSAGAAGQCPPSASCERGSAQTSLTAQSDTVSAVSGATKKRKEASSVAQEDVSAEFWESMARSGDLQKATIPAMKLFLTSVKLPVSGKKEVLVERIRKHFKL